MSQHFYTFFNRLTSDQRWSNSSADQKLKKILQKYRI